MAALSRNEKVVRLLLVGCLIILTLFLLDTSNITLPTSPQRQEQTVLPSFLRPVAPPRLPVPSAPSESLQLTFQPSSHIGVTEGYNVFSNLYLYKGQLVFAGSSDSDLKIGQEDVLTNGPAGGDWLDTTNGESWWASAIQGSSRGEHPGEARVLEGVTMIFHDEAGPSGYLPFYQHFAPEAFIPALKALSLAGVDKEPSRIIFPQCTGAGDEKGWKDKKGLNEWLLSIILPSAKIEELADWNAYRTSQEVVIFDKVVIIDRWAAHRAVETHKWSKMMSKLAILSDKHTTNPDWFTKYRETAIDQLGIAPYEKDRPVVVYFDRESGRETPRLSTVAYNSLVKSLRKIAGKAEVHLTIYKNLQQPEIVQLLSKTTVLIAHRNQEMMHTAFWLPRGSTFIELFDEGSFIRENELMSEILGINHVILRNDEVYPKDKWVAVGQQRSAQWDSIENPLDGRVLLKAVENALESTPA